MGDWFVFLAQKKESPKRALFLIVSPGAARCGPSKVPAGAHANE
jgi:hypothetical protein